MSPRAFDSDEVARSDAPTALRFIENVDCPACDEVFEGVFYDFSMSVEDIAEPPVGEHECPSCGHRFAGELTGWNFYSEAG